LIQTVIVDGPLRWGQLKRLAHFGGWIAGRDCARQGIDEYVGNPLPCPMGDVGRTAGFDGSQQRDDLRRCHLTDRQRADRREDVVFQRALHLFGVLRVEQLRLAGVPVQRDRLKRRLFLRLRCPATPDCGVHACP